MIVTLTPNPAVDVTHRLPALTLGESHRVTDVHRRAGGKGVNTAGILARLGVSHACVAPVGEDLAAWWDADLAARGIHVASVRVGGGWTTRTSTVVVTDDGQATVLNEAGTPPPSSAWGVLGERAAAALGADAPDGGTGLGGRGVLAVSGSLPGACADDPPAALEAVVAHAVDAGHAVVVDGSGAWLRRVLPLRPHLVKPNAAEAEATTGEADPLAAARVLLDLGARSALVSDGSRGAVLAAADVPGRTQAWAVRPARPLRGNPTGAGDAATAAVAAHLADHAPGEDAQALLRRVAAWSGAAVLHPLAGDLDPSCLDELARTCRVERL